MESTSTPPLPLPVSKFYQMLVRNRVRVWRSRWYIPTKYYGEYFHPTPPPPCIKILPNACQGQGKGLEEPVVHTHQILWSTSTPPLPLPVSKFYQMLVRNRVRVWRRLQNLPTNYYGEYLHPTPPPPCTKILPNAGQEQGKGLEEPAVYTHQILWRVPPPHPSPSLYQNSTKCWSGTG